MAKVDILNYISDSNILRSTYDTDTNELNITDIPQNLNSVITLGQGGGGSVTVEELNVTENGTYEAPEGKAYSPVNVNVSGSADYDSLIDCSISGTLNTNVTTVPGYALYGRELLTQINAPNLKTVKSYGFARLKGIVNMVFPSLETMEPNSTRDCSNLEKLDILGSSSTTFNNATFYADVKLNVIVIRRTEGVAPLGHTGAFTDTCFASGKSGGTLYVPAALKSAYQSATNWSTILGYPDNNIVAIEGSPYENYYVDGTPIGG